MRQDDRAVTSLSAHTAPYIYIDTLSRLFLLKGSKKEPILRSHLSAAIDPAHKKLLNPALLEASNQLRDVFGILLLPGNHFLLEGKGRKEEFMLISEREESSLRAIVAEVAVSSRAAFTGFSFAVFLCLWTAPGKRLTLEALLRKIRCVDRRFPETESRGRRGSSGYDGNGTGQELEASAGCNGFSGLLARLRAEGFVLLERSEAEGGGEQQPSQDRDAALAKQIFTLGPRFFAEVGVRRLLIAFHTIAGKELDNHTLRQLNQEEISKGNNADDSDEEEGLEVVGVD